MKNKNLCNIPVFLFILLVSTMNTATASTLTFSSALTSDVITEDSGVFNSSVNYSASSWDPNNVTSASLKIFLSDDVSTVFTPNIDAPREWASLTSVSDGGLEAINNGPIDVEVDSQLFDSSHPGFAAAAAAGIEDPSVLPSLLPYFALDVTNLIQNSNSGTLNFSLMALDLYSAVLPGTEAHDLILADAASLGLILPPNLDFPTFEDFIFTQAELSVDFDQAVTAPPAVLLIGSGLLGLLVTRKKKT
jgi:hypothetical protein